MKEGCPEFCKKFPSPFCKDIPVPVPPYDSDNGKEVEDKPLELEDPDPYVNPKAGELFSQCNNDEDCNDGMKA